MSKKYLRLLCNYVFTGLIKTDRKYSLPLPLSSVYRSKTLLYKNSSSFQMDFVKPNLLSYDFFLSYDFKNLCWWMQQDWLLSQARQACLEWSQVKLQTA